MQKWVYLKIRNIGLSDFDHGGGWVELKGKSTIESESLIILVLVQNQEKKFFNGLPILLPRNRHFFFMVNH